MLSSLRLTFLFLVATALPAAAQAPDYSLPSITVTGEASLSVAPDRAVVSAGVTSQAKTAREAMSANTRAMGLVLVSLKEQGIADTDVQTSRVSLDTLRSKDSAQVTGFQASNRVSVQLRDIAKLGDVLDRLVTAGANSIGGIEFIASNSEKLLDKVRADAIADAKRKAEIYVQAAGVGLGRPVMISEQGAAMPRPMMRMSAPAAGSAVPIAAGEERIGVTVTISYELMR